MKTPSRRTLLISGVVLVLLAHFIIRFLDAPAKPVGPAPGSPEAVAAANEEITPSVSTLARMGWEWKEHIKSLPPEKRAASEARLAQETQFFKRAFSLPEAEREKAVQEHLEQLMNDPDLQAIMAGERFKKLTKLPPETRRQLLKSYVDYKSSVTGQ